MISSYFLEFGVFLFCKLADAIASIDDDIVVKPVSPGPIVFFSNTERLYFELWNALAKSPKSALSQNRP